MRMKLVLVTVFLSVLVTCSTNPVKLQQCGMNRASTGLYQALVVGPESYFCVPTSVAERVQVVTATRPSTTYKLESNTLYLVNVSAGANSSFWLTYNSTGAGPIAGSLNSSCVRMGDGSGIRTVEIHAEGVPFSELDNMEIHLTVDDTHYLFRHFDPGVHPVTRSGDLPVPTNFQLSEIDQILFLSVLVLDDGDPTPPASPLSYHVCERTAGEGATAQYAVTDFKHNDMTEKVCTTFTRELRTIDNLLYELRLDLKIGADLEDEKCYNLVVATEPCECLGQADSTAECSDDVHISPEFTVCNTVQLTTTTTATSEPTVTTPTVSSPPTTTTTDGNGGLSGGVIAGIVIAAVVLAVAAGVITAAVCLIAQKKMKIGGRLNVEMADGGGTLERGSEVTPLTLQPPQPTTTLLPPRDEALMIFVWSVMPGLDVTELCDMLVTEEEVHGWKPLEEIFQNGQTGQLQYLTGLVRAQSCHRLYLIYEESPEWLKANNESAWKFMRDFQMRERSEDLLSRVVMIRVYERKNGHTPAETVDGPLLTVNVSKESWQNQPKECARLIRSKVRVRRKILNEDRERELLHSTTPPTDSTALQSVSIHPQSQPPPSYTPHQGTNDKQFLDQLKVLTGVMVDIHKDTKRNADSSEKISKHTERAADATEGLHDIAQSKEIDAEAPDNV